MSKELVKIKKYYGEEMMHLCRELFPTILEDEGVLLRILEATFPHSKFLYDDIVNDNQITTFKDFIYDKYHYNSQYDDYSEKELQLQAFYEQAYRIPRHFKWTTEGGKL